MEFFLALLTVTAAHAGWWTTVTSKTVRADDAKGIQSLRKQFPGLISAEEAAGAKSVEVETAKMRFVESDLCPPNDPQLERATVIAAIVKKASHSVIVNSTGISHDGEPCSAPPPPEAHWVYESESLYDVETPEEIERFLHSRRPRFSNVAASGVSGIHVESVRYHWEGKSSCAPGDPRLHLVDDDAFLIFQGDGSERRSSDEHLLNRDPCG